MESHKSHVPNHQPVTIIGYNIGLLTVIGKTCSKPPTSHSMHLMIPTRHTQISPSYRWAEETYPYIMTTPRYHAQKQNGYLDWQWR